MRCRRHGALGLLQPHTASSMGKKGLPCMLHVAGKAGKDKLLMMLSTTIITISFSLQQMGQKDKCRIGAQIMSSQAGVLEDFVSP